MGAGSSIKPGSAPPRQIQRNVVVRKIPTSHHHGAVTGGAFGSRSPPIESVKRSAPTPSITRPIAVSPARISSSPPLGDLSSAPSLPPSKSPPLAKSPQLSVSPVVPHFPLSPSSSPSPGALRVPDGEVAALRERVAQLEHELQYPFEASMLAKARQQQDAAEQYGGVLTKTVSCPAQFMPMFKQAEERVASYFAQKVEDPSSASISIMDERYIIIRGSAMSVEFFRLVSTVFGSGKRRQALEFTRNILYDLAQVIGRTDAQVFKAKMNITDPIIHLAAGTVHFAFAGWAHVRVLPESVPIGLPEKYFLFYEHPYSFEAQSYIENGETVDTPICVMSAGYSAGWCSEAFGLDTCATEVLCKARGDECCRFLMSHPSTIKQRVLEYKQNHPNLNVFTDGAPGFFLSGKADEDLRTQVVNAEATASELSRKVDQLLKEKEEAYNKVINLYV
ncbi:response regulator [Pelomyxa schiedti]|nr:response regulator [Pelomyxa schiedti]